MSDSKKENDKAETLKRLRNSNISFTEKYEPVFDLSTRPKSEHEDILVEARAKINLENSKSFPLRLPIATKERLEEYKVGAMGTTIIGLVEWALKELKERGETLIINKMI